MRLHGLAQRLLTCITIGLISFVADMHTIYLRPKGFRKDDWAIGLFRMTAQDVEDVIKDFDEEWKKALEDATAGNVPADTTPIDPLDKGKGQVGVKRKDAVEVPLVAQKKKKITILNANYRDRTNRG